MTFTGKNNGGGGIRVNKERYKERIKFTKGRDLRFIGERDMTY